MFLRISNYTINTDCVTMFYADEKNPEIIFQFKNEKNNLRIQYSSDKDRDEAYTEITKIIQIIQG